MTTISHDQFHSRTPDPFLSGGCRYAAGSLRPELTSVWATAGAVQLETVTNKEISTLLTALAQTLPLHEGAPAERYANASAEAAELTTNVQGGPVSPTLRVWVARFTPYVASEQDLKDLVLYLGAVARQHAMFQSMRGAG